MNSLLITKLKLPAQKVLLKFYSLLWKFIFGVLWFEFWKHKPSWVSFLDFRIFCLIFNLVFTKQNSLNWESELLFWLLSIAFRWIYCFLCIQKQSELSKLLNSTYYSCSFEILVKDTVWIDLIDCEFWVEMKLHWVFLVWILMEKRLWGNYSEYLVMFRCFFVVVFVCVVF